MDLKSMIDVTSYGKLLGYLNNDPSTSALIEVADDTMDLAETGEHFCTDTKESAWQVKTWLIAGKLKKNPNLDSRMAVEVIQIVPFFIFKSLNKFYE